VDGRGPARQRASPHLFSFTRSAVRLLSGGGAVRGGLDGRALQVVGEPVTTARVAAIRRTGAQVVPRYAIIECSAVGHGCLARRRPTRFISSATGTPGPARTRRGPGRAASPGPVHVLPCAPVPVIRRLHSGLTARRERRAQRGKLLWIEIGEVPNVALVLGKLNLSREETGSPVALDRIRNMV
jgi:hypothetical protein